MDAASREMQIPLLYGSWPDVFEAAGGYSERAGCILVKGRSEGSAAAIWSDGRLTNVDKDGATVKRPTRGRLELVCKKAARLGDDGRGAGLTGYRTSTAKTDCPFKLVFVQRTSEPIKLDSANRVHAGHPIACIWRGGGGACLY